jgi:transcriptional regulator with XRE-family HTH domain
MLGKDRLSGTQKEATMIGLIGHNIRRIRKQSGYSQARLAELARTSQSWICRIERGNENPSLASVTRIAGALQVDVLAQV